MAAIGFRTFNAESFNKVYQDSLDNAFSAIMLIQSYIMATKINAKHFANLLNRAFITSDSAENFNLYVSQVSEEDIPLLNEAKYNINRFLINLASNLAPEIDIRSQLELIAHFFGSFNIGFDRKDIKLMTQSKEGIKNNINSIVDKIRNGYIFDEEQWDNNKALLGIGFMDMLLELVDQYLNFSIEQ